MKFTLTEEILNGKRHFLCSDYNENEDENEKKITHIRHK